MRIILFLILGVVLAFYLSEVLSKLFHRPFRHSAIGFLVLAVGTILLFLSQPLVGIFLIGSGIGMILHHLLRESFVFSEKIEQNFIRRHETVVERLLEILPGALTWIALTSPIWLSFTLPFALAYLILLADIYWLVSALKIAVLILIGHKKMEYAKKQDWLKKLDEDFAETYQDYYHLIALPTYKESLEVLTGAFGAVEASVYPKDKIFLAVGFEEREYEKDPEKIEQTKAYLDKLGEKIGGVFTSIHPANLAGEIPGPGTNRNWMVKNAVNEFKKLGIKKSQVLVTTLDADFEVHPQFLAGALHKYLSTPENTRDKRSYTGVFLYHNNYWQAPTPMRLIATGTSFWQLSEMVGSDKYMNFASLSINLKSLLDIGLWIPNKVNDDSGFYWKAYYHFKGDYKVIPHFLPISADTVLDTTLIKTFQNQYLQQKRWAYGVEHIPFIVRSYFKNKDLDFWDKTDKLLFVMWGYLRWGILALFVSFAGLLIPLLNPQYSQSVVAYNLPVISSWILTLAFFGLFATIYVHEKTAPPRPASWSKIQILWTYIQWALIPIIIVTISTIPAIDAQTSLMLGRYMEFRTTNKARATT